MALHQVLHLNNQIISWGISETRHHNHPHLIEIIDSESKINQFLDEQRNMLQETKVLIVKNKVLLK